jgi:DNA-binding Xre family transcriptional regulator
MKKRNAGFKVDYTKMLNEAGTRFKHIRLKRGISLEELHDATGIEIDLLEKMEVGEHDLSLKQLLILCHCYQVEIGDILDGLPDSELLL